ncbi:hypothetical protein [Bradyrhizobium genosp. A]|uniref:hypothetical protein n=1 Tax=Bradyrhizobium genosp. A TaxID=83626 RepID=UPI003CF1D6E5
MRNYIEWACALTDDGIELNDQASFSALRTNQGEPLLADFAAEYLDEQMLIARKAAVENGHDFADVILCKAPDIDSGKLADMLIQLFFRDKAAAVASAKCLGEICDVAEDSSKSAIYLKFDLAADETLPGVVRDALNRPIQ